ncbi:unnamed protein product [Amoebophrya sp. A25]|nr:unnamed protein product [Amoebophrya sp. A25]|eukprot:GSA25T00025752001.1
MLTKRVNTGSGMPSRGVRGGEATTLSLSGAPRTWFVMEMMFLLFLSLLDVTVGRTCPGKTYGPNDFIDADCTVVEGLLKFEGIYGLKEIQMPRLTRVFGGLFIVDCPDLESVYFPVLDRVDHRLERSIILENNGLGYILTTTPPPQVYKTSTTTTTSTSTATTEEQAAAAAAAEGDGSGQAVGSAGGMLRALADPAMKNPVERVLRQRGTGHYSTTVTTESLASPSPTSTPHLGEEDDEDMLSRPPGVQEGEAGASSSSTEKLNIPAEPDDATKRQRKTSASEVESSSSSTVTPKLASEVESSSASTVTPTLSSHPNLRGMQQLGLTTEKEPWGQYRPSSRHWLHQNGNPIPYSMNLPRLLYSSNNIEVNHNGKIRFLLLAYSNIPNPMAGYYGVRPSDYREVDYILVGENTADGVPLTLTNALVSTPGGFMTTATATPLDLASSFFGDQGPPVDPDETTTLPPTTTTTTTTTMNGAFIGWTTNDRSSILIRHNLDLLFVNVGGRIKGQSFIHENPVLRSISCSGMTEANEFIVIRDNPQLNAIDFPVLTRLGEAAGESLHILDNGLVQTYLGYMRFPALQVVEGTVRILRNRWMATFEFPVVRVQGPSNNLNLFRDARRALLEGRMTEILTNREKSRNKKRRRKGIEEGDDLHEDALTRSSTQELISSSLSSGAAISISNSQNVIKDLSGKEGATTPSSVNHLYDQVPSPIHPPEPYDETADDADLLPEDGGLGAEASSTSVRELQIAPPSSSRVLSLEVRENYRLFYMKYAGSLEGEVQILSNQELINMDWPDLEHIKGRLLIDNNRGLLRIAFANLLSVGDSGDWSIKLLNNGEGGATPVGVTKCERLQSLSRGVLISGNRKFDRFLFPKLQSIGETLGSSVFVQDNSDLTLLDVKGVTGGNVVVHDNPKLEELRFDGLQRIDNGAALFVTDNTMLHTLHLTALEEVTGDIIIGRNGGLAQRHGQLNAPALERLHGRMRIEQNLNFGNLVFPRLTSIGEADGESIGIFTNINFQCWDIKFPSLRSHGGYIRMKDNFMLDQMEFELLMGCGGAQADLGAYCPSSRFFCALRQSFLPQVNSGIPALNILVPLEVTLLSDMTSSQLFELEALRRNIEAVFAKHFQTDFIRTKVLSYAITNPLLKSDGTAAKIQQASTPPPSTSSSTVSSTTSSERTVVVGAKANVTAHSIRNLAGEEVVMGEQVAKSPSQNVVHLEGASTSKNVVHLEGASTTTSSQTLKNEDKAASEEKGLTATSTSLAETGVGGDGLSFAPSRAPEPVLRTGEIHQNVHASSTRTSPVQEANALPSSRSSSTTGTSLASKTPEQRQLSLGQVARLLDLQLEVIETSSMELQRLYATIVTLTAANYAAIAADMRVELVEHSGVMQIVSVGKVNITGSFGLEGITQPPIPEGVYLDTTELLGTTAAPLRPVTEDGSAASESDLTLFWIIGVLVLLGVVGTRGFVHFAMQAAVEASTLRDEEAENDAAAREALEEEQRAEVELAERKKRILVASGSPKIMNDFERQASAIEEHEDAMNQTMGGMTYQTTVSIMVGFIRMSTTTVETVGRPHNFNIREIRSTQRRFREVVGPIRTD